MVKNTETRWGPAFHRFGQKYDHGLLSVTWRWKTKKTQRYETADFGAMNPQLWADFDRDLRIREQEFGQTRVVKRGHNGHRRNGNAFLNAATKEELPTQNLGELELEYDRLAKCTKETIKAVVPNKKKKKKNGRVMSEKTKELHEKRKRAFQKKKPTKQEKKKWNKRIARSCRDDYRKWVTTWTEEIERSFRAGNAKAIYQGVKSLCGTKASFATKQPTINPKGKRIASPEELANVWKNFCEKKFSPTELEQFEREYEKLPDSKDDEKLGREEFEEAVKHMRSGKATGADEIPAEVFKHSAVAKEIRL